MLRLTKRAGKLNTGTVNTPGVARRVLEASGTGNWMHNSPRSG
jgi:hypothetical protein